MASVPDHRERRLIALVPIVNYLLVNECDVNGGKGIANRYLLQMIAGRPGRRGYL